MMASLSSLQQQQTTASTNNRPSNMSLEDELTQQQEQPMNVAAVANKPYTPDLPIQIQTTQSYETKSKIRPAVLPTAMGDDDRFPLRRPGDVIASRATLPVVMVEEEVLDGIQTHDVTIVAAETGSGKSTQVPQFVLLSKQLNKGRSRNNNHEKPNKNLMIAVTQPRRVAAISIAQRVAYELLGMKKIPKQSGCPVAYQTRYETAGYHPDVTQLKFMTDGILLQEIQRDLLLRQYDTVILDEAHERNLNTDVLIGLLKLSLAIRNNNNNNAGEQQHSSLPKLKVIVMSATLRIQDFTNVFPDAGIVQIPGRLHSVTIHHAKHTELERYGTFFFSFIYCCCCGCGSCAPLFWFCTREGSEASGRFGGQGSCFSPFLYHSLSLSHTQYTSSRQKQRYRGRDISKNVQDPSPASTRWHPSVSHWSTRDCPHDESLAAGLEQQKQEPQRPAMATKAITIAARIERQCL
jgi:HrpA-like RNA helicase